MKVPQGYDAGQVRSIIDTIATTLANRFTFGVFSRNDIIQEAWRLALECLADERFDPSKGRLDQLLYRHVSNRLVNKLLRPVRWSRWAMVQLRWCGPKPIRCFLIFCAAAKLMRCHVTRATLN